MGLDMYAYTVPKEFATDITDVQFSENAKTFKEDLFYWRKHYDLHNWMENLYRNVGGKAESFNCVNVQLDEDTLNELKDAILNRSFYDRVKEFYDNEADIESEIDESMAHDLSFVVAAKAAINKGLAVFYDSWW
jgi:hypothetical protein